jgi:RNase P protein component
MKAVRTPAAVPRVRLGITVGKRHARRAVDRSLVKRMVRESFRAVLPDLRARIGTEAIDISVRLVAPLRAADATRLVGATQLRRALRGDLDRLFDGLARRLAAPHAAHG